jgi:N-acyl-D-aspartate/D-glutamate deacylase
MAGELLLMGGHVVPMHDSIGDLFDADVLLRDGVIADVGRGLSTSMRDVQVIDASGR